MFTIAVLALLSVPKLVPHAMFQHLTYVLVVNNLTILIQIPMGASAAPKIAAGTASQLTLQFVLIAEAVIHCRTGVA